MNRDREQALIQALGLEAEAPNRCAAGWIGFVIGMIVMFFVMGVVPHWTLIKQIWQGCVQ
ncbi:MAG: hypothetical protein AB1560_01880 [Pseudomonadota bacterium]